MAAAQHARVHDPELAMRDDAGAVELLRRIRVGVTAEVKRLQRELAPVEEESRPPDFRWRPQSAWNAAAEHPGRAPAAAARARLTRMAAIEQALDGVTPGDFRGEWAGPGSIVVVQDTATGEREEHLLLPGDVAHLGRGYLSLSSPIGEAVAGRGAGATVAVVLPHGVRTLRISALITLRALVGVDASDLDASAGSRRGARVLEAGPAVLEPRP